MLEELSAWCSLWRAPGVGSKTYLALLKRFGTPSAFFLASEEEVRKRLPQCPESKWRLWRKHINTAQADLAWLQQSEQHHIITWNDERYPYLLRQLPDPPPVLFVKGAWEYLSLPQLAIIGSRSASQQALNTAHDFAQHLAANGLVITSGLALGIDGAAHMGALKTGLTVAVVGTGLDRVYPRDHHRLAHEIAQHGTLVSEFPIGSAARAHHFPQRNRLISGLSTGVLVVEASLQSGSLITARLALEQGREVLAIPGSIHNPLARGCHQLIRQGAKLVESAEDIWQELQHHVRHPQPLQSISKPPAEALPPAAMSADEERLLQAMAYDPCSLDDVVEITQLPSAEVASLLSLLELEGHIRSLANGLFQRV